MGEFSHESQEIPLKKKNIGFYGGVRGQTPVKIVSKDVGNTGIPEKKSAFSAGIPGETLARILEKTSI